MWDLSSQAPPRPLSKTDPSSNYVAARCSTYLLALTTVGSSETNLTCHSISWAPTTMPSERSNGRPGDTEKHEHQNRQPIPQHAQHPTPARRTSVALVTGER